MTVEDIYRITSPTQNVDIYRISSLKTKDFVFIGNVEIFHYLAWIFQ